MANKERRYYEIYKYHDEHKGWGYGEHVEYVTDVVQLSVDKSADDHRKQYLEDSKYGTYGHGIRQVSRSQIVEARDEAKQTLNELNAVLEEGDESDW